MWGGGSQNRIGELLKRMSRRRAFIPDARDFFLAEWTNSDLRGKKNSEFGGPMITNDLCRCLVGTIGDGVNFMES